MMDKMPTPNGNETDPDEERICKLVEFASKDESEPIPNNPDAWKTWGEILKLEQEIGDSEESWHRRAHIFAEAAQRVQQNPTMAAVFHISALNGARRVAKSNWTSVEELWEHIRVMLDDLTQAPRKTRLQNLLRYHGGIIKRYLGKYEEAAEIQRATAEEAEANGDRLNAAISRLCEHVERLSHALKEGEETERFLKQIGEAAERVADECTNDGNPTQIQWRYHNVPMHVLQAYVWGRHKMPEGLKTDCLAALGTFKKEKPREFKELQPIIIATKAGLAMLRNDREEALQLVEEAESLEKARRAERPLPEARATALLIRTVLGEDASHAADPGELETTCGHMHQLHAVITRIRASRGK